MKTRQPLILTAKLADDDLEHFDRLRKTHFPPNRNVLRAHLTMFHRLPGEYVERICEHLAEVATGHQEFLAQVAGIRHLGAGVAFTISSQELWDIRARLRLAFAPWLGGQDMQKWQPHITIQNKVPKTKADELYQQLQANFTQTDVRIIGLDLWRYLDGPWEHASFTAFNGAV
ncbi:2'-5' RNA ligase family protein [Agrobacterium vaccinii]|uniref:2'-5' RNA ligase family protein n=1 Tax=Agrobacterium vaccinii TaxID=2735528 RepID=UPI00241152E2|nr:2'-5' RNA ligase family protein [Agrobacterium vaccinii]UHS58947.1 2'-5' RNA ligase family protein [Agrobacterium vaccinii]